VESLGYSTLWLPDTVGRDPFAHIAWLGSQTENLQFATGIANMARMGNAIVLPMWPMRDAETGKVHVTIEAPFEHFPSGDDMRDLAQYNDFLERHIRRDPAQYFWVHRRFKTAPDGEGDRYAGIGRRRSRRKRKAGR